MELERSFFMVPLEVTDAVALLQWMRFGGCGWLSSTNGSGIMHPSFTLMKRAPKSASAADDATNFKMVQRTKFWPLSVLGYPSLGNKPRNKWPDAHLLEFLEEI